MLNIPDDKLVRLNHDDKYARTGEDNLRRRLLKMLVAERYRGAPKNIIDIEHWCEDDELISKLKEIANEYTVRLCVKTVNYMTIMEQLTLDFVEVGINGCV